jgi:Flp pilus assembly protein TadG
MVEFTLVSFIFLFILLGTIDFGRAIFTYAELHNAVREGARYARVHPSDSTGTKSTVVGAISGFTLTTSAVTVSCSGSCGTGDSVTVSASYKFSAVAQTFLNLSPITLTASATDAVD